HPEGRRIAVGYKDASDHVSIYDVNEGTLQSNLASGKNAATVTTWRPDGSCLAISGDLDPRIQLWDADGSRRLATLDGHSQAVVGLSFHPDGDLLASHSYDGTVRIWETASGRQWLQAPLHMNTKFSTDGRKLGLMSIGRGHLFEFAAGREYRTL